jgi:hypothetical protein
MYTAAFSRQHTPDVPRPTSTSDKSDVVTAEARAEQGVLIVDG